VPERGGKTALHSSVRNSLPPDQTPCAGTAWSRGGTDVEQGAQQGRICLASPLSSASAQGAGGLVADVRAGIAAASPLHCRSASATAAANWTVSGTQIRKAITDYSTRIEQGRDYSSW